MSNYSPTTDFAQKDSLPSGDLGKIIRGTEFETEFDNIATAVNSKSDANNPTFTGTVTIDGLTVNGNTVLGNAATDTVTVTADIASNLLPSADDTYNLGAVGAEWNDLFIDGVANIDSLVAGSGSFTSISTTGDVTFGDNNKALFGAGSDLQIYHNGSNSFITDTGTGSLYIRASDDLRIQTATNEEMLKAEANGAVTAYYDNAVKLATTATGIDVTGTVSADDVQSTLFGAADGSEANPSIRNIGDSNTGFWFPSADTIGVSTGGNERMRIDSSGKVGIGTSSPSSALHVSAGAQNIGALIETTNSVAGLSFKDSTTTTNPNIASSGNDVRVVTGGAERMRVTSNGQVGIGLTSNTSANSKLQVTGSGITVSDNNSAATAKNSRYFGVSHANQETTMMYLTSQSASSNVLILGGGTSLGEPATDIAFRTGTAGTKASGTEAMRITEDGSVGIGTSNPDAVLHANKTAASGDAPFIFENSGTSGTCTSSVVFAANGGGGAEKARIKAAVRGDGYMAFHTNDDTEKMRITSSGTLLAGKTTSASATVGVELRENGVLIGTASGIPSLILNRTTSDGTILDFRKNNAPVGSIGCFAGDMTIGVGSINLRFFDGSSAISPCIASGAVNDNAIDLGVSNSRFKDLYLSGGAYLGGTAAANKLDSYEEGTFTPSFSGGDYTFTYNKQKGSYTKIGNRVFVDMLLYIDSSTAPSGTTDGDLSVTGLPFTFNAQNTVDVLAVSIGFKQQIANAEDSLSVRFQSGNTEFKILKDLSTGFPDSTSLQASDLAADSRLRIQFSYPTNS